MSFFSKAFIINGMENYNFDIQEELKKLPAKPGVYIMHDERDHIIYVGKAISLKNRVRQYFQTSRNKGVKIEQMVTHIRRFEYIVTDSELEALVLECNLIKEHHPKYNTMLMDDKTYPFIKVTVNEDFPRVMLARKMLKDKAKYLDRIQAGRQSEIRLICFTSCIMSAAATGICQKTSEKSALALITISSNVMRLVRGIFQRKNMEKLSQK